MICNAVLKNSSGRLIYNRCLSTCLGNSIFCQNHQDMTIEEYKRRWFDLFILGVDGHDPFFYSYNEKHKNRILEDLESGCIVLSVEDIERIPNKAKYIDIYLLLIEYGYIDLEESNHVDLYCRCLKYLSDCISIEIPNRDFVIFGARKKIRDVLILKNTHHLYIFLCMVLGFYKFPEFRGENLSERLNRLLLFLKDIMKSDVGKEFLWGSISSLHESYKKLKKNEENCVLDYLFQEFIPLCRESLKQEKQKQKNRTDAFKEELMMVCWHPDRFVDYCLDEEEKAEIKSLL
jgi:hypothetical protein